MHAVAGPQSTASEIAQQLACGKSSCRCQQSAKKGTGLTHCPVHADNDPSMNVSVKNDVVLVHCQATCSQEDVLAALREKGLWADVADQPITRVIVATYDYKDASGKLLYQAVRYAPKDFRQRRPDEKGDWIWNLEGVERVLYHLPQLLAADPKRLRFIVEGEKDVEALERLGFVATCNVGGAGKWKPEYSEWFHDRDVVLIPDNDEPGRNHMVKVADYLMEVAHSIRWLDLVVLNPDGSTKPKSDVSDWIDTGGTPESLKKLVRESKFYTQELVEKQAVNPLSDINLERAIMAWCFEVRTTVKYLKPDDFTDLHLRKTLERFLIGEYLEDKPAGVPEADPSIDIDAAITKLRDLSYRRASIRIADCIVKAASDTYVPFDPHIAGDLLRTVCEPSSTCTGVAPRLSECLDLS